MMYKEENYYSELKDTSLYSFIEHCKTIKNPEVLELGVFQSIPGRSTMHKEWIPHSRLHYGTDIEAGEDVDIVADVHKLSEVVGVEQYDVIITCSTFEHFRYPHIAAFEIARVLRPGGVVFVQTHSTFPIHAYPYDYFRFTEEALSGCFGTRNGITVKQTDYAYPATISSPEDGTHKAWLNVNLFGMKTHRSPENYIYEWDTDL